MNLRCWFGHKYKLISYENYRHGGYSYDPKSFMLRYICERCKKVNIKRFPNAGYITNEQFYEIWETTNVDSSQC